jgi:guanine deaminase
MSVPTVYYGSVINPTSLDAYEASPHCLIAVSSRGDIDWLVHDVPDSMVQEVMGQQGCTDAEVVTLKRGEFIIPGFIDTVWFLITTSSRTRESFYVQHTHAPQVPNMGR